MNEAPRELDRLLAGEIERWLQVLIPDDVTPENVRAALHSLKGSAGLAGHADLSLLIGQAGRRWQARDAGAKAELVRILELARERLSAGLRPLPTSWPAPPPGIRSAEIEPPLRASYWAAMRERLARLDAVLASRDTALAGLERAHVSVHAMKGSASAAGDELTAWYCHGLETRLRAAERSEPRARELLVELGRHRALLGMMIEDSRRGLAALEHMAAREAKSRRAEAPSDPASRPATALEPTFQLQASALDRLLERVDRLDLVHAELGQASAQARRFSARLRAVRANVVDALRVLGPARPWGPPHAVVDRLESAAVALYGLSGNGERGASAFRASADFLRSRADEMRAELGALRQARLGEVLERLAEATVRLAEAESKLVHIEIDSADFTIDRRVADHLYDALLQLVRNAVAHGIQRPEQRQRRGKAPIGTLTLRAERHGEWLRVIVEDDGQGADVERIRALAVERGTLTPELSAVASESQLLSLLFLPGFTTHAEAGLLAGRGLGLDLVQESARALGGVARLERRASGAGLSAVLDVPVDRTVVHVLWIEEAGFELALPVSTTRSIHPSQAGRRTPRLAACLGATAGEPAALALELSVYGVDPVAVGIDRALGIEEVTVRPLPALLANSGPFSGAILRADGSLRLALDVPVVAARAWAAL